jgi:hypothetical protein
MIAAQSQAEQRPLNSNCELAVQALEEYSFGRAMGLLHVERTGQV